MSGFGGNSGFGGSNGFGTGSSSGVGFGNSSGGMESRACFNCNQKGHRTSQCPEAKKSTGETSSSLSNTAGTFGNSSASFGNAPAQFGSSSTPFGSSSTPFGSSSTPFGSSSTPFGSSSTPFGSSSVPFGGGGGEKPTGCFNCGQEGHNSKECTEPRKPREGNDRPSGCFNCGATDHIRSNCPSPAQPREDGSKPASTFVPIDEPEESLYNYRIEKGVMFERFYEAAVTMTRGGMEGTIEKVNPIQSFEELHLTDQIQKNVTKSGYTKPTPVQQYATPLIKSGSDMLACAQTGSGKTAAFLLPIMSKLLETQDLSNSAEIPVMPRCLILAPTRELAVQIYNEARKFSYGTILSCKCLYGGTSVAAQKNDLRSGSTIIVGTTGRVKHFLQDGIIDLSKLRFLVLDEADRMLDMGFGDDVNTITMDRTITSKNQRQTLMFSATFPPEVQSQASHILSTNYAMITIDHIGAANKCITQEVELIANKGDKRDTLLRLLGVDKLRRQVESGVNVFDKKTLIFVSKKTFADTLGNLLCEAGVPATTMHGDRLQQQRSQAINEFVKGRKAVLVATAVAERGLDIKGVDTVINYDMPDEIDQYVHRIGRTGRVGHAGRAISLFCPDQDGKLAVGLVKCMEDAGQVVPDWLKKFAHGGSMTVHGGGFSGVSGFEQAPAESEEW